MVDANYKKPSSQRSSGNKPRDKRLSDDDIMAMQSQHSSLAKNDCKDLNETDP